MHYYKRNIGDYAKKAGRLSILQHGVYNMLIDSCYDRERFPNKEEAVDWTWAASVEEIEAVDLVLKKFFVLEEGVYVQKRIQQEIQEYLGLCESNKINGKQGGRPKGSKNKAEKTHSVNKKTHSVSSETQPKPKHNPKPLTTNHKPLTNKELLKLNPDDVNPNTWAEFIELRERKKAEKTPRALSAIIKGLSECSINGVSKQAMLEMCLEEGWKGVNYQWYLNRSGGNEASKTFTKLSAVERVQIATGQTDPGAFSRDETVVATHD